MRIRAFKLFLLAAKIAVGSCASIYIAQRLGLEFASSAGSITLLSIVTTKWETLKLSLFRILSFFMAVVFSWVIFVHIESEWVGFGIFVFLIVFISEWIGWKATISVNAVIGTHFLQNQNFTLPFIQNEFSLVLLGIFIAILCNLFQVNSSQKKRIIENMRYTERELQKSLGELACYLNNQPLEENVWDEIIALEKSLAEFTSEAYEYQNNTFPSHPSYYISYFEMRTRQCNILHNLHYEMKKVRDLPKQAEIIAEYIDELRQYVIEKNDPVKQLAHLEQIFSDIKKQELPRSQEEVASWALLYHILMDLEDFLIVKRRFIESIDAEQKRIYEWEMPETEHLRKVEHRIVFRFSHKKEEPIVEIQPISEQKEEEVLSKSGESKEMKHEARTKAM